MATVIDKDEVAKQPFIKYEFRINEKNSEISMKYSKQLISKFLETTNNMIPVNIIILLMEFMDISFYYKYSKKRDVTKEYWHTVSDNEPVEIKYDSINPLISYPINANSKCNKWKWIFLMVVLVITVGSIWGLIETIKGSPSGHQIFALVILLGLPGLGSIGFVIWAYVTEYCCKGSLIDRLHVEMGDQIALL